MLPAQSPKLPSEIYSQFGSAVVLIQGANKAGSGVIISTDDMEVVTNFHVIEGEKSVKVRFANGLEMTTDEVFAADADLDLAILRLEGHAPGRAELGNSANVLPGDPIVVISNPLGIEGTISSGLTTFRRKNDGLTSLV